MSKHLYNLFRNRVNREIKKPKKQYVDYFNKNVNNIKKNCIKKIVNIKNTSSKTSQLNICGNIKGDDKEIAANFNNYFVNIGPFTENSIPKVPNISPSRFLHNHNQINFVIAHISNEEIL